MEWKYGAKHGQIVAGGNGEGNRTDQLNRPTDVVVDKENDSLIICDQGNRRVIQWSPRNNSSGQIIISDIDYSSLTMDNNGYLYVSDWSKDEVRRWRIGDRCGTIVAGGNGQGDHLNQLCRPNSVVVDDDYSVYVSDECNHRVMKWVKGAKEGVIVAGRNGQGNSLTQLSLPQAVIVDQLDQIYVADGGNDRVMRWCKGATQGSIVVGANGKGAESNQFNGPCGLSFDRQGNLYVVDSGNHRIQKFEIDFN
jgi:sugar lactone lactonase YvrE